MTDFGDQAIVDLWLVPPQEDDGDAGDNGGTGPPGPGPASPGERRREMMVWCERCGVGFYHEGPCPWCGQTDRLTVEEYEVCAVCGTGLEVEDSTRRADGTCPWCQR